MFNIKINLQDKKAVSRYLDFLKARDHRKEREQVREILKEDFLFYRRLRDEQEEREDIEQEAAEYFQRKINSIKEDRQENKEETKEAREEEAWRAYLLYSEHVKEGRVLNSVLEEFEEKYKEDLLVFYFQE